jgi:hypothetical protein
MTEQPKVGDRLFAEWHGTWYEAEVVRLNGDGSVHIHYTGWGEESDESLPLNRLARTQPTTSALAAKPSVPGLGPIYADSLDHFLMGEPVDATTPLRTGDNVHVLWQGSWWAGEVMTLNLDGSVNIHYKGWDSQWDEVATRDRLQLPARGPKLVTFHLEPGWAVTGTVVKALPDSFVFNRAEDHRVCAIRKEQVRYLELHGVR